ncbi:hypothetical protein V5N11_000394 [Cardamine amara subsp. amara]|uniref:Hydroxyproline-rich glycoprotein family protein n=1 Tax=Cardamine amara subsp. amara TaxID=228776 RepID=A0ABD0ZFX0_CARAN
MEEEDDRDASTPFWLQSRRNNTNFRRTASLGSRATTVATQVFFAGVASILIVFFIIPPLFSSVSQIFRPHLVRKSWDYLNFVLVLFAVVCGFLSRNTNNDETNHNKEEETSNKFSNSPSIIDRDRVSNGATPRYWIDDRSGGDQTVYKRFSRLRSSSSYPDLKLREFESDERWRFYDDTRVSQCRYEDTDTIYPNRNWQEEVKPPEDVDRTEHSGDGGGKVQSGNSNTEKVEVVTTAEAKVVEELTVPSAPPYIPSPPPSPPRAPPPRKKTKRKTKRVYQDVATNEEKKERGDFVAETPPMTPIPPPATVYQKSNKQEKKKGGATKDFLTALRRKKQKQRQQSIDGLDLLFGSDPPLVYTMPPPPPPPPPPFFQGLFSSKKGKSKRTNSNQPPPPPPPPPPERRFESRASMAKIRKAPMESRSSKSNPPAKVTQFVGTGSELMPIPPPPPPPPFKMPAWKFVKRGDYVRMASDISISSDEPDDPEVAQSADGKATAGSVFCPSPDVDTKADDFIARFRAGLKLEKMNSVKRGRSNLGPEPGPDESGS